MEDIPFFGGDDNEDDESNKDETTNLDHSEQVGDLTIRSNSDITVHRPLNGDENNSGWFSSGPRIHTISVSDSSESGSESSPVVTSRTESPDQVQSETSSPADHTSPSTAASSPTDQEFPPRTFVLPQNKHFLQKLEARGRNGHKEFVETVYVLTGPTPTQPTDLIRLDMPELYGTATRTSVEFGPYQMAREVANLYPSGQSPGVIARFHTHPPDGSVTPSAKDRQSAPSVRRAFVNAFDTDNFEFFHGIHQLEPHNGSADLDTRQSPQIKQRPMQRGGTELTQEYITWTGEQYRHRIAAFGRGFASLRDVALRGDSQ
jgi:proteasome lid subunit RPN8/RPN11